VKVVEEPVSKEALFGDDEEEGATPSSDAKPKRTSAKA
jgi:hypothetical protein